MFPNPASDLIAIQIAGLVKEDVTVVLKDVTGRVVQEHRINAGQTIAYFDVTTLYSGNYFVQLSIGDLVRTEKVIVQ